jgi:hypothetical protein
MWMEAILTKADLETVLRQFSPLKIVLGDSGSLLLAEPKEVLLIPDEGIGVVCDATLHWPVLGFDVPVHFHGLTVRIRPLVDEAEKGKPLVFRIQLDHTGMAILPALFDSRVTAMVNDELTKKHVELSWNFMETLTHAFDLPLSLASSAAISLVASDGTVKCNGSALGLAVRFETAVRPRPSPEEAAVAQAAQATLAEEHTNGAASAPLPPTPSAPVTLPPLPPVAIPPEFAASPDAFDMRSFVVGSAVAAAAFTTVGGLARLFSRGRHRSW